MEKLYLISPNYVRENSEFGADIEDKFIFRSILTAQDIDLQRVLGTELYEIVMDEAYQYAVTGTSLTDRIEDILDDYILPIVLYSVLKSAVLFIYAKVSPKTVGTNDGGYTNPVDYPLLTLFSKKYDDIYQNYVKRLTNFLTVKNENNVYPEWGSIRNDDGKAQNMAPGSKNYFSGLETGDNYSNKIFNKKDQRYY